MKQVRIAELKARLSEYLRAVRNGETIAVLDRDTPVAQIVPVRDSDRASCSQARPPRRSAMILSAQAELNACEAAHEG
jgi:prevent-host-death family protein